MITEPKPREVITIYVIDTSGQRNWAQAIYNFRCHGILKNVRIPIRPHFGVMGVAPKEADYVDSIPPGYFHGQLARGKGRDDVRSRFPVRWAADSNRSYRPRPVSRPSLHEIGRSRPKCPQHRDASVAVCPREASACRGETTCLSLRWRCGDGFVLRWLRRR